MQLGFTACPRHLFNSYHWRKHKSNFFRIDPAGHVTASRDRVTHFVGEPR